MCAHADLPLIFFSMAPFIGCADDANLMLDSDVDDPVVEDNMVDNRLFVGLFVLDVDDSSCKLTVVYMYCHTQVVRPCLQ